MNEKILRAGVLAALAFSLAPSVSAGPDLHSKQRAAQVKALAKKQRVREQIRARKAAKGAK